MAISARTYGLINRLYLISGLINGRYPINGLINEIYLISGLILSNGIIPNEDCQVFVPRCRSTSQLTCPVLFRQVHLLYVVVQVLQFIHTFHTFIAYTHSCIYNMHTTPPIDNRIILPESSCIIIFNSVI